MRKKERHVPMRMCIVTRERMPKKDLMRFVRVDDKVKVDPKGKERGRGANIKMDVEVFDKAASKHLIEKSLKLERKLTREELKELRKDFENAIDIKKFRSGNKPVILKVDKKKWIKVEGTVNSE